MAPNNCWRPRPLIWMFRDSTTSSHMCCRRRINWRASCERRVSRSTAWGVRAGLGSDDFADSRANGGSTWCTATCPYAGIGARVALPRLRSVYTEHNVLGTLHRGLTRSRTCSRSVARSCLRGVGSCPGVDAVSRTRSGPCVRMPPVETLYHGIDPCSDRRMGRRENGVRAELGIAADAPVVGTVANCEPRRISTT